MRTLSSPAKPIMICAGQNQLAENRISELPDDILYHIVSFLPVNEVGKTCVLSKRWKHVWQYVPTLNFDSSKIIGEMWLGYSLLKEETLKYLDLVDHVISSFKAPVIDEFSVLFKFSEIHDFTDNIYDWLRFAIERRVKRLAMNFSVFFGSCTPQCFTIPKGLSCTSLTSLELGYVNVTGEILESFLCNCLALEHLSVKYSRSLLELTAVTVPMLKLKSLIIEGCYSMKKLEISAPNLVYISYFGNETNMQIKNTRKLAQVSFGDEHAKSLIRCFSDLSSCLSQIVSLTLCSGSHIQDIMLPNEDLVLPRLRNLDVSVKLYVDYIRRRYIRSNMGLRKPTSFLHYHLKNVKIAGFCGKPIDEEIAVFLIKMAVALEVITITIDPAKRHDGGMSWYPQQIRMCAEDIRSQLKTGTKLEIL